MARALVLVTTLHLVTRSYAQNIEDGFLSSKASLNDYDKFMIGNAYMNQGRRPAASKTSAGSDFTEHVAAGASQMVDGDTKGAEKLYPYNTMPKRAQGSLNLVSQENIDKRAREFVQEDLLP